MKYCTKKFYKFVQYFSWLIHTDMIIYNQDKGTEVIGWMVDTIGNFMKTHEELIKLIIGGQNYDKSDYWEQENCRIRKD